MSLNPESQTQTKFDEPVPQRPDYIPEKFWDQKSGSVRIDQLAHSYKTLEKKLSNKQELNKPAAPDQYDIKVKDNLFDLDETLNDRLRAKGFSQEQAQEVYDLAVEYMLPIILSIVADYKADREAEKLIAHFGGVDGWNETARQLKAYGEKTLSKDALQGLAGSFDGIMALHKMMVNDIGDGITVRGQAVGSSTIQDINTMMKNPKYWRDRDPSYIAKVTEAFERIYE